jgi:hypothetical protein
VKKTVSRFDTKWTTNKKKEYIKFDFGPLWSVLDMNNEYKRVFLTLSHVTNFTNVEPKLRPDFDHLESHLFGKKKKTVVLLLNNIEFNGLWGGTERRLWIFYATLDNNEENMKMAMIWCKSNYYSVWIRWWWCLAILWEYIGETWIIRENRDSSLNENWTMSKKEPNVFLFPFHSPISQSSLGNGWNWFWYQYSWQTRGHLCFHWMILILNKICICLFPESNPLSLICYVFIISNNKHSN